MTQNLQQLAQQLARIWTQLGLNQRVSLVLGATGVLAGHPRLTLWSSVQANSVSVVDHLGNVLSENQGNDSISGLSNNQLAARRDLEQYLSRKAEGMLEKALGPDQAIVRVA